MRRNYIMPVVGVLSFIAVLVLILALVSTCSAPAEPADGVDSGKVIERSRRTVVVLEDDGERDKHSIHKRSTKCQVGSRWPDCKK